MTGVSRRAGIGFAVARRLQARGDRVAVHSWAPHDHGQPWGGDDLDAVLAELGHPPGIEADLADPGAPAALVARARDAVGPLTTLVVNHARSSSGRLAEVTAEELDTSFAVNARAAVLLTQAFAAQYDPAAGPGAVVLFTSGQHRGPMVDEIAYALSKGAVQQITATMADELIVRGITVNCLNPCPTYTGWAAPGLMAEMSGALPRGRLGSPNGPADVVL